MFPNHSPPGLIGQCLVYWFRLTCMYQSQYRALPFITETCKSILSSYIWGNQHKKMSAKDFCRVNNDFLPSLKTAQKNPTFSLMHSHQWRFLLFRVLACPINFLLVWACISISTSCRSSFHLDNRMFVEYTSLYVCLHVMIDKAKTKQKSLWYSTH